MKVVVKAIEVVSWTNIKGKINPVRFKITKDDDSTYVVKVDKVICTDK